VLYKELNWEKDVHTVVTLYLTVELSSCRSKLENEASVVSYSPVLLFK
jgi:hypothetical protein